MHRYISGQTDIMDVYIYIVGGHLYIYLHIIKIAGWTHRWTDGWIDGWRDE